MVETVRDIITKALSDCGLDNVHDDDASFIIAEVEAAGYRILAPGQVDEWTRERAAKMAEGAGDTWSGSRDPMQCCQEAAVDAKCEEITVSIRSLKDEVAG